MTAVHVYLQFIITCFFPLFPFFFPFPISPSSAPPSTSLAAPLPPLLPLAPHGLVGVFPRPPSPSLLTMPEPYPKIVLCGFGAGGSAGNISAPLPIVALPDAGPLLAGLLVGAELGFEDGAEEPGAQGTVLTFPGPVLLLGGAEDGGGRPGNGLAEFEAEDAVPHERVCETDDREDAAVDDLSFRTRFDFAAPDCVVDEEDEACAQPRGIEPLGTLGPGRDG
jgi:hypothetical protein